MDEVIKEVSPEEGIFTLKYDGKALKNHTIDVKELQLVVAGVTEFLNAANKVINRGACTLKIKFGVPKAGSFDFTVFVGVAKELLDVGASAKFFLKYAFEGWKLWVQTKGRKPQKVEQGGNGNVNITCIGDNNTIHVITAPEKGYNVCSDKDCRCGLRKTAEVLKSEGYERYDVKRDGEEVTVREKDAQILSENNEEEGTKVERTETEEMWIHPIISCDKKAGWKFRKENNPCDEFRATVEDEELLERFKRRGIASSDRIYAEIEIATVGETEKQYRVRKILKYEPVRQLFLIGDTDKKQMDNRNKDYF